jgi:hypothetical protein
VQFFFLNMFITLNPDIEIFYVLHLALMHLSSQNGDNYNKIKYEKIN